MSKDNILIIHEEDSSRKMLRCLLKIEGYIVDDIDHLQLSKGYTNLAKINLVLLGAGLDSSHVNNFLQIAAEVNYKNPVILLIPEKVSLSQRAFCQQQPIHHQIQRPFSPRSLISMIKSCTQSAQPNGTYSESSSISVSFDDDCNTVSIAATALKLASIEYRMFKLFYRNVDKIFSREDLLHELWGAARAVDLRTVDVHIRRLRRALSVHQLDMQLQTVHGAGYRFAECLVVA